MYFFINYILDKKNLLNFFIFVIIIIGVYTRVIIVKDNYNNLCTFNFGKHCYAIIKNGNKVVYFESVNDRYVMPITSFNLFDNEGKSLNVVNHHFFMNQLVNRINIALKKGFFLNDQDLINYLIDMKNIFEKDTFLKKLFNGSVMGEINEINFEDNKKKLLSYLDKFKFDTFVDYNSVSVLNGSLEKSSVNFSEADSNLDQVNSNEVNSSEIDSNSNEVNSVEFTSVDNLSNIDNTNIFDINNYDNNFNFGIPNSNNEENTFDVDNDDNMSSNSNVNNDSSDNDNIDTLDFDEGDLSSTADISFADQFNFDVNKYSIKDTNESVSSSDYFDSLVGNQQSGVSDIKDAEDTFDVGINDTLLNEQDKNYVNNDVLKNSFEVKPDSFEQSNDFIFDDASNASQLNANNSVVDVNNSFGAANDFEIDINSDFGDILNDSKVDVNNDFGADINNSEIDINSDFGDILNDIKNSGVSNSVSNDAISVNTNVNNDVLSDKDINSSDVLNDVNSEKVDNESYITEVKNRIESNNSSIPFVANDNVNLNNSFVDKNELPDLESIASEPIEQVNQKPVKHRSNKVVFVVVMFIIIAILIVISYFLYNYVF